MCRKGKRRGVALCSTATGTGATFGAWRKCTRCESILFNAMRCNAMRCNAMRCNALRCALFTIWNAPDVLEVGLPEWSDTEHSIGSPSLSRRLTVGDSPLQCKRKEGGGCG